jgi:hypothetical protein
MRARSREAGKKGRFKIDTFTAARLQQNLVILFADIFT